MFTSPTKAAFNAKFGNQQIPASQIFIGIVKNEVTNVFFAEATNDWTSSMNRMRGLYGGVYKMSYNHLGPLGTWSNQFIAEVQQIVNIANRKRQILKDLILTNPYRTFYESINIPPQFALILLIITPLFIIFLLVLLICFLLDVCTGRVPRTISGPEMEWIQSQFLQHPELDTNAIDNEICTALRALEHKFSVNCGMAVSLWTGGNYVPHENGSGGHESWIEDHFKLVFSVHTQLQYAMVPMAGYGYPGADPQYAGYTSTAPAAVVVAVNPPQAGYPNAGSVAGMAAGPQYAGYAVVPTSNSSIVEMTPVVGSNAATEYSYNNQQHGEGKVVPV